MQGEFNIHNVGVGTKLLIEALPAILASRD